MRNLLLTSLLALLLAPSLGAQVVTKAQQLIRTGEDSLQSGFDESRTVLSGYGSAFFQRDTYYKRNRATLERVVLFVGHQFNRKFAFFSEMELENARVEGGEAKGELSMEQAYIRYNINADQYLVAGLFIPRIGLLNENHLPVNFNGVERPQVETWIIPATWRELGVGWYAKLNRIPLQLSAALVTGLDSRGFVHGTGIREGAQGGALSTANNCALTASATYNWKSFRFQVSGYAGGTTGENPRRADSLHLNSGAFGTPFYLGEANLTYSHEGFQAKALAVMTALPEAARINAAYARNNPERMVGSYLELAYDVLYPHNRRTEGQAQCLLFGRVEYLDLNSRIPAAPRGLPDGTLEQRHLILGVNFMPIPAIAFKADVRLLHTGEQNKDLLINPSPNALPYSRNNSFINVGIGYSF